MRRCVQAIVVDSDARRVRMDLFVVPTVSGWCETAPTKSITIAILG